MWIFFPYIYEIIFSNEELVRTANYKAYDLIEIDLSIFKIIFNTFFGAFINMGDINLLTEYPHTIGIMHACF